MYSKIRSPCLLLFIVYAFTTVYGQLDSVIYSGSTNLPDTTIYTETTISTMITSYHTTTPIYVTTQCVPAQNLFMTGGKQLNTADDIREVVQLPVSVPVGGILVDKLYIYTNGLVSELDNFSYSPRALTQSDSTTFAPFWTDIDISLYGKIYYKTLQKYPVSRQISDDDNKLLEKVNVFIKDKANFVFDSVYALIVTWENVIPHRQKTNEKEATFQFLLTTNGTYTYVSYIYDTCSLNWDESLPIYMGYTTHDLLYNNIASGSNNIISESLVQGNNGGGTWTFLVASDSPNNYKLNCLEWHWANKDTQIASTSVMIQCPCTITDVLADLRFEEIIFDETSRCFTTIFESFDNGKVCCYVAGQSASSFLLFGNALSTVPSNNAEFVPNDAEPYNDCCVFSDYCNVYEINRPQDTCGIRKQCKTGVLFGDPHFRTLDGHLYTFNGLGEFELLNIYNKTSQDVIMKIQCRTRSITSGTATVFEAFAFETNTAHVQVMTSLNAVNAVVLGDRTELTRFNSTADYKWTGNGVVVKRDAKNTNAYIIIFDNGVFVTITFTNSILDIVLGADLDTSLVITNGLLGTVNGNTSDDFQLPDKSFIPIDSDEKTIYYKFGKFWATNSSIFVYENGLNADSYKNPNYVPDFWNKSFTLNETVNEICGNKSTCIFDYLQTKSEGIAINTREMVQDIDKLDIFAEYPTPVINGTKNFTMVTNQSVVLYYEINYDHRLNLTLNINRNESARITLNGDRIEVIIIQDGIKPVTAEFFITTNIGHITPIFDLNIKICPECKNSGICNGQPLYTNSSQYLACSCSANWTGNDCSVDNRCAPYPCHANSTKDLCICDCPVGFEYRDGKCADKNECNYNICNQTCLNTYGSYECQCKEGFVKSGSNNHECKDIDECLTNKHGCQHECQNTYGSYECKCFTGSILNADKKTCKSNGVSCNTNCTNYDGCSNGTCFCKSGYTKTGKGCIDTNECNNKACGSALCKNTDGSFVCYCNHGEKYDQPTSTCKKCSKNMWGPNCSNECNSVFCDSCNGSTGCVCKKGLKGDQCNEDIDECVTGNDCNVTTSTCNNMVGSYRCLCKDGFKKDANNIICKEIDECKTGIHKCSADATCTNVFGSYNCSCNSGYIVDGFKCTDVDECKVQGHSCEHFCENTAGSYACKCRTNYKIEDDRNSCLYYGPDVCKASLHNCSQHATCKSKNENYTCTCIPGYEGNGFSCTDIDECKIKTDNCSTPYGKCTNTDGGYNCSCIKGALGDGFNCTVDDLCKTDIPNCSQFAECSGNNENYTCTCIPGYEGDGLLCTDINECKIKTDNCSTPYGKCTNTDGGYNCSCITGASGDGFNCTVADLCKTSIPICSQHATCRGNNENYTCTCIHGYEGDGLSCTDINECKIKTDNCSTPYGKCTNTDGGYSCSCVTGASGDGFNCTDIDECKIKTDNCSTLYGKCTNTDGGFSCSCIKGTSGDGFNCTVIIETELFHEYMIYAIVGAILGFLALLVLLCLCCWCIGGWRRRRRRRHETLLSTLEHDPYRVNQSFGSFSSTLSGKGKYRQPIFGNFLATKYLRNWGEFSPDQREEPIPGPSGSTYNQSVTDGLGDSKWQHILDKINKTDVFHIDRPEISSSSYHT